MKQRIMVLGNCVADRLRMALELCPSFVERYTMVASPMIHTLSESQWQEQAATPCDIILTQPLFSFGPCNTAALLKVTPRKNLVIFPSPNFEAYFPDVFALHGKTNLHFQPIYDWDSQIIFSCFVAGVPIFEVAEIYRNHALFQPPAMKIAVEHALAACRRRDEGVDVPISGFIQRNFAQMRLFHSWLHPDAPLLVLLLSGLLSALDLPHEECRFVTAMENFSFNCWPLTCGHGFFSFPEQTNFVLAGQEVSVEDAAMAYYNFYEFHPHVVEQSRHMVIPIG